MIKESDIDNVFSKLNGFCPSLNFTANKFDDGVVHYWDLKTIDNKTDIYYNDTHIGQYMHFSSYKPWNIYDRVVIRNYVSKPLLRCSKSNSTIPWSTIALKIMIFLRSFSVFPKLEK